MLVASHQHAISMPPACHQLIIRMQSSITEICEKLIVPPLAPVDVISAAELTTQPSANMIDQLKNIVPSFYAGQNSISDASTFVRSPSRLSLRREKSSCKSSKVSTGR